MYQKMTHSIEVTVRPFFVEEQSTPEDNHFVFGYHIRIHNRGEQVVKLLNRHWRITDGRGRLQEVKGPGVVGEQPVLGPGQVFEYTSACPLTTPSGIMVGTYEMVDANGERFLIDIPAFSLDYPDQPRHLN
jgi:ApaG protein